MNPDRVREQYLEAINRLSSILRRRIIVRDDVTYSTEEEIVFGTQYAAATAITISIVSDGISVTNSVTSGQGLTHFYVMPRGDIAANIEEILRSVSHGMLLNVTPNRRIRIPQNEMIQQIIETLLLNYNRSFPDLPDLTRMFDQMDAMAQHIFNRFYYTFIIFRYIRHLEESMNVEIILPGGSQTQDQPSGQGQSVHASHLARFRINPQFALRYPLRSSFILRLLSVTENMDREINMFDGIGGEIDRFSADLINHPDIDLSEYTERFIEIIMARLRIRGSSRSRNTAVIEHAIEDSVMLIRNSIADFEEVVELMVSELRSLGDEICSRFAR